MKKHVTIGILSILTILLLSISALAAPGVPHQFYGSVTVNGNPAPNNLFVEARVDGSTYSTITSNAQYGYNPIFYAEDPDDNRDGKTITFFVGTGAGNMIQAATYTFSNGYSTRLDLSVTGLTVEDKTNGGGGGGSTGGAAPRPPAEDGVTTTTVDEDDGECVPQWICSEWTECFNNQQRRVCVDRNECGDEDSRPEERRSCEMTEEELFGAAPGEEREESGGILSAITGFVTGVGGAAPWIGLIVLLALIAGLYLFVFSTKKKKKKR